jgi:hypothetical protein
LKPLDGLDQRSRRKTMASGRDPVGDAAADAGGGGDGEEHRRTLKTPQIPTTSVRIRRRENTSNRSSAAAGAGDR